jgi:hypothetical protein
MIPQAIRFFNKYGLELVAWAIAIPYLIYIWIYYSWQAFVINIIFGILGLMAVLWMGEGIPIVGYFLRKWEREKREHDKRRRGADKGNS